MMYFGYQYDSNGEHSPAVRLVDQSAVIRYIRENLESPQLIITDDHDRQLLLLQDGVDLFNDLDRIGISLNAVFNQIREKTTGDSGTSDEKPKWEILYDQIGLSPGEIRMRQRVKSACRVALTVEDVADLVRGTYFDAHFFSSNGQRWYRYFDENVFSAALMVKDKSGEWIEETERFILSPSAGVRHVRSSEDIHTFEILDPEDE